MKKKILKIATVLALVFIAIGCFYSKSINIYTGKFHEMNDALAAIKLSSVNLTDGLLRVRSGYVWSFDDLLDAEKQLEQAKDKLYLGSGMSEGLETESTKWLLEALYNDFLVIEQLVYSQLSVADQFKSSFSSFRNADYLFYQLINDARDANLNDPLLLGKLDQLELEARRLSDRNTKSLDKLINEISKASSSVPLQESLLFASLHLNNKAKYRGEVDELVDSVIAYQKRLASSLDQAKKDLLVLYNERQKIAGVFSNLFLILVASVIIFSVWQAFIIVRYSLQVTQKKVDLEKEIEARTQELHTREAFFRAITETASDPIILADGNGNISFTNDATLRVFGYEDQSLIGKPICTLVSSFSEGGSGESNEAAEWLGKTSTGDTLSLAASINQVELVEGHVHFAFIMHDITSIKTLEKELADSQKLESVGQLAAGIAHEINTPSQFISDNLTFLEESVADLMSLILDLSDVASETDSESSKEKAESLLKENDFDFLKEEVPAALSQSQDGIRRVASIVKAMKDYSHPGESFDMSDINMALQSTITLSKGEWKYICNLETDFDSQLPLVECVVSDINQVVLNMIVNAAHAIGDCEKFDANETGEIKVTTRIVGGGIEIVVSDNGTGVPEHIQRKIFDPFFTTKAVGKGTGQGLSIAHKIVVQKHHGLLSLDSVEGEGATFTIWLPVNQPGEENSEELVA